MTAPFIIYSLPRSRTFWLSQFLSYGDWTCWHKQAMFMRTVDDIKALFGRTHTGSVEIGAGQARWLIKHAVPHIKEVVILRPVEEVIESTLKLDVADVAVYDPKLLRRNMEYSDRVLRNIAKDSHVLAVDYAALEHADACAAIFEHCLPYEFDPQWWDYLRAKNLQTNIKDVLRYYHQNIDGINAFKRNCKMELIKLCREGVIRKMGV